jgi:ketosteroid isomerase-like protein
MSGEATHAARALYDAAARGSEDALGERLDRHVIWDVPGNWRRLGRRQVVARDRTRAIAAFAELRDPAARVVAGESIEIGERVVVELEAQSAAGERRWYAVVTVDAGRVVRIREFPDRDPALHEVGLRRRQVPPPRRPTDVP